MTQDELKQHLRYDPETGEFFWLNPRRGRKMHVPVGCNSHGYLCIRIGGTLYKSHRLAYLYMTGHWPELLLDHINGVRGDNRWCNLRMTGDSGNSQNVHVSKNCKSGIKGVCWAPRDKRWRAYIGAFGRTKSRYFVEKQDAIEWVVAQRAALHGEFANHG